MYYIRIYVIDQTLFSYAIIGNTKILCCIKTSESSKKLLVGRRSKQKATINMTSVKELNAIY